MEFNFIKMILFEKDATFWYDIGDDMQNYFYFYGWNFVGEGKRRVWSGSLSWGRECCTCHEKLKLPKDICHHPYILFIFSNH